MRSPASRHSRLEEVVLFIGDKRRRAPRLAAPAGPPPWLGRGSPPNPRSPPPPLPPALGRPARPAAVAGRRLAPNPALAAARARCRREPPAGGAARAHRRTAL